MAASLELEPRPPTSTARCRSCSRGWAAPAGVHSDRCRSHSRPASPRRTAWVSGVGLAQVVGGALQLGELVVDLPLDPFDRPVGGAPAEVDELAEQAVLLLLLREQAPVVVGDEVDLGRAVAEEQDGVDVDVADASPEVDRVGGGAHPLALADGVAPADVDRAQEGVGGAHPVGVEHHHVELAADLAGEGDHAVGRGRHRLTAGGGVLDSPVAGAPPLGGRPEPVDDGRVDRRPVGDAFVEARRGPTRGGPGPAREVTPPARRCAAWEPPRGGRAAGGKWRAVKDNRLPQDSAGVGQEPATRTSDR